MKQQAKCDAMRVGSWQVTLALSACLFLLHSTSAEEPNRVTTKPSSDVLKLPDLPIAITSFGADRLGDAIYVYGGHHGRAHHYSNEGQSGDLLRLNLNDPKDWEKISAGPKRQGLLLIAYDDMLYRIGGFEARNDEGRDHDLWSVADCAQFNTKTRRWEADIPMPTPRSSFDGVLVGETIYVIGGWEMAGAKDSVWRDDAYALNLSNLKAGWQAIAKPPFKRRALCVGTRDGLVYAVGGMQPKGKVTTETAIYDPGENRWRNGPQLPGEEMEGFGPACCTINNELFVSTSSGKLLKLSRDGESWIRIAELPTGRFFHQMLPLSEKRLINIAGAHMEEGRFKDVEVVGIQNSNQD